MRVVSISPTSRNIRIGKKRRHLCWNSRVPLRDFVIYIESQSSYYLRRLAERYVGGKIILPNEETITITAFSLKLRKSGLYITMFGSLSRGDPVIMGHISIHTDYTSTSTPYTVGAIHLVDELRNTRVNVSCESGKVETEKQVSDNMILTILNEILQRLYVSYSHKDF